MRLAFLADIHGNLPALEAVLHDLRRHAPDAVYLAGDQISRVPWHNEVMSLLASEPWPAIYGNHEWVIGRLYTEQNRPPFTERERFLALYWTQETLAPEHLATVRDLPSDLYLRFDAAPPIRLTHGVPGNCFSGVFPFTPSDRAAQLLRAVDEPVAVLGHTHRPMDRSLRDERTGRTLRIFNGGSVGLPYNGDPRAQYLLLDLVAGSWEPTFCAVEFDHSQLRAAFEQSGMLEAVGATGELHVLTALTGEPWSSDFGYWIHAEFGHAPPPVEQAVALYLERHGPGHWAFTGEGL